MDGDDDADVVELVVEGEANDADATIEVYV
jgi:hypothetical protein